MMKSMTAFGRARMTVGGKDITVEIKSVNSRYFDCSVKISHMFSFLEERVKPYLQANGITRGKVDVYIGIDVLQAEGAEISVDFELAEGYVRALRQLGEHFSLRDDISIMGLARYNDILKMKKPEDDMEKDWQEVVPVLSEALSKFLSAREKEGANLEADIKNKIESISGIVNEIERLSAGDVSDYRVRLEEKIRKILDDNKIAIDENRILTECAIFADKVAIDEEIVRLRSHFRSFSEICASDEPVGRKLDFLIQEMNRETNTIGSKCNNSVIARHVVDIKTEIEKIREQIQNIE